MNQAAYIPSTIATASSLKPYAAAHALGEKEFIAFLTKKKIGLQKSKISKSKQREIIRHYKLAYRNLRGYDPSHGVTLNKRRKAKKPSKRAESPNTGTIRIFSKSHSEYPYSAKIIKLPSTATTKNTGPKKAPTEDENFTRARSFLNTVLGTDNITSSRASLKPGLATARQRPAQGGGSSHATFHSLDRIGLVIAHNLDEAEEQAIKRAAGRVLENQLCHIPCLTKASPKLPQQGTLQSDAEIEYFRNFGWNGQGVRVGMIDSGFDDSHEELRHHSATATVQMFDPVGKLVPGRVPSGFPECPSHGTAVASLIAGKTLGVVPDVTFDVAICLTERVRIDNNGTNIDTVGGYALQIASGIDWLVGQHRSSNVRHPILINGSFGFNDWWQIVEESLAMIFEESAGAYFVAAIGNDGSEINRHSYPANDTLVLGIGAVDSGGNVANFSDWGVARNDRDSKKPDFCAVGDGVRVATQNNGFAVTSGTSFAAPVVTGAIAAIFQGIEEASISIENVLDASIRPIGSGALRAERAGRGVLDLRLLAQAIASEGQA